MATVRKVDWTYKGVTKSAWQVTYTDPHTRKRPTKNFKMKKAAEAYRLKVEREVEDGKHVSEARTASVKDVVVQFEAYNDQRLLEGRIGRTHIKKIREIMRNYVVPRIGGLQFNRLTFIEIERWHRSMLDTLSPASARRYLYQFKEVEDFARKRGYTSGQVVSDVCRETRGVTKEKVRQFSRTEALRLFDAVENRTPECTARVYQQTRCFVYIAAFCGLRFGEIKALTLRNVDCDGRLIRVRHNITQFDELKGPKTRAGVRDVPMPTQVARMIADYIAAFYRENERELIFTSRTGTSIAASAFHNVQWRPALQRAGLDDNPAKRFHFHALRHMAGSLMIDHGVSMPRVADLMGHSTFDTTLQVYAHTIVRGTDQHSVIEGIAADLVPATRQGHDKLSPPSAGT